jgi:hypothetical protein
MIADLVLNFVGEIRIPGDSRQLLKLLVVMQKLVLPILLAVWQRWKI